MSNITLHPALPEDAHTLAKIHNDAFISDTIIELMYGPPDEELTSFTEALTSFISSDNASTFVKAVDESGVIVGWVWWDIFPDAESYRKAVEASEERRGTPPPTAISPQAYLDYYATVFEKRERWISGGGVALLRTLVVDPKYQGQGIGTQLLVPGVEKAKSLKLPAWLESSESGYTVYKRCGFRDVGDDIVLDLSKYGSSGVMKGYCMRMDG